MPEEDFKPFTIGLMQEGISRARDAWKSSAQSFQDLQDVYIRQGRLKVRTGYTIFSRLLHQHTQTFAGTAGLTVISGTLAKLPVHPAEIAPSTYAVTFWDGGGGTPTGKIAKDNGAGLITGAQVISGTINYATGVFTFTYNAVATNDVKVAFEFEPDLPVTGLKFFRNTDGTEYLVACDTKRFFLYSVGQKRFVDFGVADVFTGAASDYFHFCPMEDDLFFTNNFDPPRRYDPGGASHTPMTVEFDGGHAGNDIDHVSLLFQHLFRIHHFATEEVSVENPQRVRRSLINQPETYLSTDFSDIPTVKQIQTAGVLNKSIVVFADGETWLYRYTGDVRTGELRAPYTWDKISTFRGGAARLGVVELDNKVAALSIQALLVVSPQGQNEVNITTIPDLNQVIESTLISRTVATIVDELDHAWFTFVPIGGTETTKILVWDYENGPVSIYNIPSTVFSLYKPITSYTYDDFPNSATYDNQTQQYNSVGVSTGFPLTIFGNKSGRVFIYDKSSSDNGADITWSALSHRLNPYSDQQAHLGFVDIVCDRQDGKTVNVSLFKDYESAAYLTTFISLTGSGSSTRVRRRIHVNQRGYYHQIQMGASGTPDLGIDAVMLWMKPDGEFRNIG